MIWWEEFKAESLNINLDDYILKVSARSKKPEYYNIACTFDTETTSEIINGQKVGYVYIWMCTILDDRHTYYGRSLYDLVKFMNKLIEVFDLSLKKRLVIYIHNMPFDFQFFRKFFQFESVFAVDTHEPIKAVTVDGIEFRDSYILAGKSLSKVADDLTEHEIKKMIGDLDYRVKRNIHTPLTEKEMRYCEHDTMVLCDYIIEQMHLYGTIKDIPMTNTGRVRKYIRDYIFSDRKRGKKYTDHIKHLTLTPFIYNMCKAAFHGGFTHANYKYMGKRLHDVTSLDFTSSYPTVLIAEKYPMGRPIVTPISEIMENGGADYFKFMLQKYCMVFRVRFENLESVASDDIISESKCLVKEDAVINNGRVHSAAAVEMILTNIDYLCIKKCYKIENTAIVGDIIRWNKDYLPKEIIECILHFYNEKTIWKDVPGKEVDYQVAKGMLNSIYGMCVTDVIKPLQVYEDDDWKEPQTVDIVEAIEKYNSKHERFLYYPWGIFCTAYAMKNLVTGILECGDDYIYSDTDSVKIMHYEKHIPYFENYNKNIIKKLEACLEYYNIDKSLIRPHKKDGTEAPLGVWDFEGTYSDFKTLGAKRYLFNHPKKGLIMTVAGLGKRNGLYYMREMCYDNHDLIFDFFSDNMNVPPDNTGKLTHTYIDTEMQLDTVDYLGNEYHDTIRSCINLESCSFNMSISTQYASFIRYALYGIVEEEKQYYAE